MNKSNKQIVNYDPEADVLAVYVRKGQEEEFVEISPDIIVEIGKGGAVLGFEILNASKILKPLFKASARRAPVYAR